MNFLSLTDVSLTLGDTPLFTDVTLGIDSGERIGFIGPNGAGKSTFLSVLTGKRLPDDTHGDENRRRNPPGKRLKKGLLKKTAMRGPEQ